MELIGNKFQSNECNTTSATATSYTTLRDTNYFVIKLKLLLLWINAEVKLKQQEVKINREIQFTTWLFDTLHEMLVPHGSIAEPENENKCIIPTLGEYSTA